MTQRKQQMNEDTQLNEEMDVFEEFEAGAGPEETTDGASVKGGEGDESLPSDDLGDLPGFDNSVPGEVGGEEDESLRRPSDAESLADDMVELAPDIPVNLVAVVGKKVTSVGDLMNVRLGQVIDLGRPPGETVDLVANGRLIARGELVEMDGKLGVRILKMVR